MRHYYPAIFEPLEEGGFIVTVPDIEGCFTEGGNLDEAMLMTFDVIGCVLNETEESDYPPASNILDIDVSAFDKGSFVTLVMFDKKIYDSYENISEFMPSFNSQPVTFVQTHTNFVKRN
ncbi:MAG: type II toxin-antitoxin system HicB family antitoxin [Selenomonadaceae bacterium]|nr:type II toxin-antitoxin system HicB family antitoxin [Selenomonadaceae bacterium]MBQ7630400.1 type II toxin-antitoxin system HicB family antitoxin [Selenomonadaceae bacterium]